MCNLTGFVLVNAADNIAAHDLAPLSVQEVLLKIGFCGLVVVDDGSNFKGLLAFTKPLASSASTNFSTRLLPSFPMTVAPTPFLSKLPTLLHVLGTAAPLTALT
jgi:hypothetical protein